jgi:polar amino acid transport system permease protein
MPVWLESVIAYGWVGVQTTIFLALCSGVLSLVGGVFLGGAAATFPTLRVLVSIYNQIWRGLPVLVTLFMVFFLLPTLGLDVNFFATVVAGLSLWGSANIAEIVLGAVKSIPPTQFTAAQALGFRPVPALCYVILPQAARRMLPSLVGILVSLIQATSLSSAIGAVDLLESVHRSVSRLTIGTGHSHAFPIYAVVLLIYFLLCFPLTLWSRRLERRFQ